MDIAKKEFKSLFKEPLEAEGFTYAGNTFYRHVNDVLQTLTLRKTFCTFEFRFGIFPICIPISGFLPCGILYPIAYYEGDQPRPFSYSYDQSNIHELMEQGLSVIVREIIPVFQSGTDCKTAYEAVVDAQRRMFSGTPDGMILHDISLEWMALKNRNYEQAHIHHLSRIAQQLGLIRHETKLADILKPEVQEVLEKVSENDPPHLIETKKFLHRIIQKDSKYFQELMERNTQVTLDFLQKVKKSPGKYGKGDYLLF